MKKYYFLLLIVIQIAVSQHLAAQTPHNGSAYKTTVPILAKECDLAGDTDSFSQAKIPIPAGTKFTVIHPTGNAILIQPWLWENAPDILKDSAGKYSASSSPRDQSTLKKSNGNDNSSNTSNMLAITAADNNNKVSTVLDKIKCYNYYINSSGTPIRRNFLVSDSIFTTDSSVTPILTLKNRLSAVGGAATLPFKWRLQKGAAFDPNLSISGLGGVKWIMCSNHPDWSLSGLLGIGVTSVALDSSNSVHPSSANLAAVTLSCGVLIQYQSLQLGLFVGCDKISNNKTYGWQYQGNPWIGIGIGFTIFSPSSPTSTSPTSEGKQ